jgi:hypothetical protein
VAAEDVAKVEALALSTLAKAAEEGFEEEAIEASLNTLEFQMREFNTGGFPKGLSLMLAVMPRWLYGHGAPSDALRFEKPLASLKKRLARRRPLSTGSGRNPPFFGLGPTALSAPRLGALC